MTTIAWVWLAAFGGFVMGYFVCLMMIASRDRDEEQRAELERIFRL